MSPNEDYGPSRILKKIEFSGKILEIFWDFWDFLSIASGQAILWFSGTASRLAMLKKGTRYWVGPKSPNFEIFKTNFGVFNIFLKFFFFNF